MNILEIIAGTVVVCSLIHIPIFVKLRRKLKAAEVASEEFIKAKATFFESIQAHSATNAHVGCRLCSACKRVVHRYEIAGNSVICLECKIK